MSMVVTLERLSAGCLLASRNRQKTLKAIGVLEIPEV